MKPFTGGRLVVRIGKRDIADNIPDDPMYNLVCTAISRATGRAWDTEDGVEVEICDELDNTTRIKLPASAQEALRRANAGEPVAPFFVTLQIQPISQRRCYCSCHCF